MKLIAGRNFNTAITSDTVSAVIVNEALVKDALNTTPEKAIGAQLKSREAVSLQKKLSVLLRISILKILHARFVRRCSFTLQTFSQTKCLCTYTQAIRQ